MAKEQSFEKSLTRLQEIVGQMERGEASLEESLKLFEEGAGLSAACYDKLKKAEQKITEINAAVSRRDEEDGK